MRDTTPWADWLRAGVAIGIAPSKFWALSLREWRALMGAPAATLSAADFAQLQEAFPDQEITHDHPD
jgi:hypothetical protein